MLKRDRVRPETAGECTSLPDMVEQEGGTGGDVCDPGRGRHPVRCQRLDPHCHGGSECAPPPAQATQPTRCTPTGRSASGPQGLRAASRRAAAVTPVMEQRGANQTSKQANRQTTSQPTDRQTDRSSKAEPIRAWPNQAEPSRAESEHSAAQRSAPNPNSKNITSQH